MVTSTSRFPDAGGRARATPESRAATAAGINRKTVRRVISNAPLLEPVYTRYLYAAFRMVRDIGVGGSQKDLPIAIREPERKLIFTQRRKEKRTGPLLVPPGTFDDVVVIRRDRHHRHVAHCPRSVSRIGFKTQ